MRYITEHTGLFSSAPGHGQEPHCLSLAVAAIQGATPRTTARRSICPGFLGGGRHWYTQRTDQKVDARRPTRHRGPWHASSAATAAQHLLEVFTRRYETGATLVSSNRPVEDWGQMLGDTAAAGAMLDSFLNHAEIVRLQGRSWRSARSTGGTFDRTRCGSADRVPNELAANPPPTPCVTVPVTVWLLSYRAEQGRPSLSSSPRCTGSYPTVPKSRGSPSRLRSTGLDDSP